MNAKNNRRNHNFQIRHFLAGSCHTPDGAYALLCDLLEDRELSLAEAAAHALRTEARTIRARRRCEDEDEAEQLEGQAELAEIQAHAVLVERNIAGARAEVACIRDCMADLAERRRFAHLPDPEAHEAAQHDEWLLELIHRAQNHLATTGTIPPDQFSTMRQHPAFEAAILPAIDAARLALAAGDIKALVQ